MITINRYKLIEDFKAKDETYISLDPYFVMAVVQFKRRTTFSRSKLASFSENASDGIEVVSTPLIIVNDVVNYTITHGKSSHVSSMQVRLKHSDFNYAANVGKGDWAWGWVVNSREKAQNIISRIKKNEPCNNFDDGLKFMGRIQSTFESGMINPENGISTVEYTIHANGFTELNAKTFYDPYLVHKDMTMNDWAARIGIEDGINALIEKPSKEKGGVAAITINKVIPKLLSILVGKGISQQFSNLAGESPLQSVTGLESSKEAPYAYIVPKEVGKMIGKTNPSKSSNMLAYSDLLELNMGLHRYTENTHAADRYRIFIPDGLREEEHNHKFTHKPLMGLFTPTIPSFTNQTVWGILSQFLNPHVNEMYTAMRVNNKGKIVPTLMVRQLPFSTEEMLNLSESSGVGGTISEIRNQRASSNINTNVTKNVHLKRQGNRRTPTTDYSTSILDLGSSPNDIPPVTPYLELPRWQLHNTMVKSWHVGSSNTLRINFLHVYGQSVQGSQQDNPTNQLVRNPPIRDEMDIKSQGLSPYMGVVAVSPLESMVHGPKKWMEVMSDWMMGLQNSLTGTINLLPIQSPIVPGDNVEWNGVVYHIEDVTFTGTINPENGTKKFGTMLQVSHGMRSNSDPKYVGMPTGNEPNETIYANIYDDDTVGPLLGLTTNEDM